MPRTQGGVASAMASPGDLLIRDFRFLAFMVIGLPGLIGIIWVAPSIRTNRRRSVEVIAQTADLAAPGHSIRDRFEGDDVSLRWPTDIALPLPSFAR